MAILKQSTAFTRMFMMIDSADHVTGKTGLSPTVTLSKAGGSFAAAGGTVTEVSSGWYKIALTTTDTNTLGELAFHVTGTGADPTDFSDQVAANILGDTLPANVLQWNSSNVSSPATAGIPDVNVKNMNNVAATSITTINANQGTTQPINFTGTGASALAKSDMVDIAGAAVSTSTAQLGVNLVNIAGSAVNTASAQLGVNIVNVKGSASAGAAGYMGLDWSAINAPTTVQGLTGTTISSSQAIASVSGAVGSVTGNVGGNVTGSVGSVTGNVGGNVVGSVASVTAAVTVSGTSALTESYAALGSGLTLAQALYGIHQFLVEHSTGGTTTWTVKKRDRSTTAFTGTLDSATTPTSLTQAS